MGYNCFSSFFVCLFFIFCSNNYLLVVVRRNSELRGCWSQVRSQKEQAHICHVHKWREQSLNLILKSQKCISLLSFEPAYPTTSWVTLSEYSTTNLHVSKIEIVIALLHQTFANRSIRLALWSLLAQHSRQPLPPLRLTRNSR